MTVEIISTLDDRNRLPLYEVAGFHVRCIASNIREKDNIDWRKFTPAGGIGYEGDLVLGQVLSIGARKEMEYLYGDEIVDLPLSAGDYIVGVLANRHSGTSEYGEIPTDGIIIKEGINIDLIAAGGILGHCLGVPKHLGDTPTKVKVVGLLAYSDKKIVDLRDFYPPWKTTLSPSSPIVLISGTAAEIGKTTTGAKLVEGLKINDIERVAATKLAGTGRKRDIAALQTAGGDPAYDFPDVGLPTTYTSAARFTPAIYTLLNKINREGNPQIIIGECGGDIIEGNIPTLLQDQEIMRYVAAIVHSSTDVLSIMGSLSLYEKLGILGKIPIYLTYPIKRNYYAIKARLTEWGINFPIFDPLNNQEATVVVNDLLRLSRLKEEGL